MTEDEQYGFDLDREWVENEANNLCKIYLHEGNGLQIWRALREMHEAKLPIPPSIVAKFVEWSYALEKANSPAEICQALELAGGEKQKLGIKHAKRTEAEWRIAGRVSDLMRLFKIGPVKAISLVSRDTGKPEHTVKKAFYRVTSGKPQRAAAARKNTAATTSLDDVMRGFGR